LGICDMFLASFSSHKTFISFLLSTLKKLAWM
jgi:hypothetical protein